MRGSEPSVDFRMLFEAAPGLYLVLDNALVIVAVSDAYLKATMTDRKNILGRGIFEIFPDNPDDPNATGVHNLRASLERVLRSGTSDSMAVQKYDIRRPDGGFEERYWSPVNCPVRSMDGSVPLIIHRVEDVTEFVHLKERGHRQAELTRELQERSRSMEMEILRRSRELQDLNERLRQSEAGLEAKVRERTAMLEAQMRENQRLEMQFRQAQKMDAIGTLAGGVAHDFNNLLTVITGYSELVLLGLEPDAEGREAVQQILKASARAAALTRQLLAFSRQQVVAPKVLQLNAVISDLAMMLTRLIGEDIQLRTQLDPALCKVKADPGQIEQLIMNLVVNSRDAMPHGGILRVSTHNVTLDERYVREHVDARVGPYVQIIVQDSGCGMDEATKARIFEPFFTTKAPGKGSGLGLATVFGIVKQCGGFIWVDSELGIGTTCRIYLPCVDESGTIAESIPLRTAPERGHEVILLVEDDESVRNLAVLSLQRYGYTVLPAHGGREAVLLSRNYVGTIDLLVSDVVMPEMGGRAVAEHIRRGRPHVKLLFCSGYTDDDVLRQGILLDQVPFLQKPFTPEALARRVREVLDG